MSPKHILTGRDNLLSLRYKAEKQVALSLSTVASSSSADELMHELQVHQVELEMQNDELRRAQVAIEESRDRFVDLYEFAPIGYLTLDSLGAIIEINLTGAELLGVERGKLIRRVFAAFVARENSDTWYQYFKRVKHRSEKQFCELVLQHNNGSFMHVQLVSQRIKDDASTVRIALSDITERKRLEMEIQERNKQMAELHTLHVAAQTAAAIAHELNQPLLSIASYSEAALMLMNADKPDLEKIRKAIYGCERQAQRAGQSIRDLLEFLSIQEFTSESFDLGKEILNVLEAAKQEHELQFDSIFSREEGHPPVKSCRAHVQKVLLNLIYNSVEAMREAGAPCPAITVTVHAIKDENFAHVTIRDNGPGIKQDDLQRLFEPFFTTKDKGIGMGLAISRSLIEENGGQLWVDPPAGSGATFHITLPFAL